MVVFWKWIEQEDEETGKKKEVPFLRYYNVFHIGQCEGISTKHTSETAFPDGASTVETTHRHCPVCAEAARHPAAGSAPPGSNAAWGCSKTYLIAMEIDAKSRLWLDPYSDTRQGLEALL